MEIYRLKWSSSDQKIKKKKENKPTSKQKAPPHIIVTFLNHKEKILKCYKVGKE